MVFVFYGYFCPFLSMLLLILYILFSLLILCQFRLDHVNDLTNRIVLVLNHTLLPHEENIVVQNLEEQGQVRDRLVHACVRQLCAPFQNLVNSIGVGLSYNGKILEGW